MSKTPFDKFMHKEDRGARKKEKIRQEKKKIREEKNAWFEERKKLAREGKVEIRGDRRTSGEKPVKVQKTRKPVTRGNKATIDEKVGKPIAKRNPASKITVSKKIKAHPATPLNKTVTASPSTGEDEMPLNKFIAWCGVCSRREAAELVKAGKVKVNDQIITEPPFRVSQRDVIKVNGKRITIQKNLVYILLNKPKDYITTTDDPEGRKTVMDLVKKATSERVFPVGRLDRNTTGVLLITNDGDLAQRLTHPKYRVRKIYEVHLDKPITRQQLEDIANGITLDDGFIQPDAVAFADPKDKRVVGIEIHSGKNRIVRRIFEHAGFSIKSLDRVMYGIFTKKNIERGKWRYLTDKEIRLLKYLNTSFGYTKTS